MRDKIISGMAGYAVNKWSIRIITIISTIIVARILGPEAFGQSALIISSILLIDIFFSLSFDNAIIQANNKKDEDYNVAWTFSRLFKGLILFILLQLLILVADYYNVSPLPADILQVSAFYVLIHAFFNTAFVKEIQNLNFLKDVIQTIIPGIVRPIIAVVLAIYLNDVRAIIYAWLIQAFLVVLLSYMLTNYRVSVSFNILILKKYLRFVIDAYFVNVTQRVRELIDTILIVNILGFTFGGFYQIGKRITGESVGDIRGIIEKVMFPAYSSFDGNIKRVLSLHKKMLLFSHLITIILIIFLILKIELIILVLLGEKWLEATLICQLILCAGYFTNISGSFIPLFRSLNLQRIELRSKIIEISIILIGCLTIAGTYGFLGIGSIIIFATFCGMMNLLLSFSIAMNKSVITQVVTLVPGYLFALLFLIFFILKDLFIPSTEYLVIQLIIDCLFAIFVVFSIFAALLFFKINLFGLETLKIYELIKEQIVLK